MKTSNIIKLIILLSVLGTSLYVLSPHTEAATLEVGSGRTYSTIQSAVNAAQPGDTVLVYPGTYAETVTTQRSGTAAQRITIRAVNRATENTEAALRSIIDGENIRTSALVFGAGHGYITIEGFYIIRHRMGVYSGAIDAWRTSVGSSLIIEHNVFEFNIPNPNLTGEDREVADLEISGNSSGHRVRYNKFFGQPGSYSGMQIYSTTDLIIEYNEVANYDTWGLKFGSGNSAPIIRFNYFHGGTGYASVFVRDFNNSTFNNNLFADHTDRHIHYQWTNQAQSGHRIFNNTFVNGRFNIGLSSNYSQSSVSDYLESYNNIMSGGDSYFWFSGNNVSCINSHDNVYYNVNLVYPPCRNIGSGEQQVASNPLANYLSLSPFENKGANIDISVWPYQVVSGPPPPDTTPPSSPTGLRVQ